jgi:hypothetical protein
MTDKKNKPKTTPTKVSSVKISPTADVSGLKLKVSQLSWTKEGVFASN